jgi:hypothetical protein
MEGGSRKWRESRRWKNEKVRRFMEGGSGTRRRPIKRDYTAAKDAEGGNGGKQKMKGGEVEKMRR